MGALMDATTRLFRHFLAAYWQVRRDFPEQSLNVIESAIRAAEASHAGEIRFAIEAALRPAQLIQGMSARERALEVFSLLRVWDTEQNSGVLIYVLLGDRDVEIIADRGIQMKAGGNQVWQQIVASMRDDYAKRHFEAGTVRGIAAVAEQLAKHFPAVGPNPNELPDEVVLL